MSYCVQADVERAAGGANRLKQLADWNGDTVADSDVIAEAISSACGWIDSYVRQQRAVPLVAPVPDIVRRVAAEEAVYLMKSDRGMATEQDTAKHEERRLWLVDVSRGRVSLGVDPQPTASSAAVASAGEREADTGVVTRSDLGGLW